MCSRVAWLSGAVAVLVGIAGAPAQELPGGPAPAAPRGALIDPEGRRDPVGELEELVGGPRDARERAADEIETDRDSFTPATGTVAVRRLIVESAYSFIDNRGFKETHSLPELVCRYGLTDRVEVRLGWNYEVGGEGSEVSSAGASEDPFGSRRLVREYTLSYGVKVRVTDQAGWVPRSAVILQAFTPTGGSTGASPASQLVATYAAGWLLPGRWRFDAAMRYATASETGDRFNLWAPSAVLKVPVGERWAVHGEYFGFFSTGKERGTGRQYVSPGVHCLLTPDLEVGVRLGWGLNDQSARFFSNVGFGWRF